MKFARLLLFFSLALSLRLALAQPNAKPAPATPIRYSRDIPKSVLKMMPRGAKSLFWGTFSPKTGSVRMAVHLSALRPRKDFVDTEIEATYHFALDVFTQSYAKWSRINHVPVTYSASMWGPVTIATRLFELNEQKDQPVLVFDVFTKKSLFGTVLGDGVFVTFSQGWTKPAQVQNFQFGSFSDGNYSYEIEADADGQIQVETGFNEPSGTTKMIYRWNGREFFSTPETTTVIPLQP